MLESCNQKIVNLQEETIQSQLLGQQMFAELSNELPQNEVGGNVNSSEGNDSNNNIDAADHETDSSEPQRTIRWCSSPD